MAIVMAGSLLGAFGALFGLFILDLGLLAALGLWAASGPASLLVWAVVAAFQSLQHPAHDDREASEDFAPAG